MLQGPCCHNSHRQHGLHLQPAHPGVQQVLPVSHRKPQLPLTCGSPGSTPGCKGCISSPRLELKSLLGNSGPVLFLPPGSPVQSPKGWSMATMEKTTSTSANHQSHRVRGRAARGEGQTAGVSCVAAQSSCTHTGSAGSSSGYFPPSCTSGENTITQVTRGLLDI